MKLSQPGHWNGVADQAFENVRIYVIRGRTLQALSADELRRVFIQAMTEWAGRPLSRRAQVLVADAGAEYQLRAQSPPYEFVRPQVERLVGYIVVLMAALTEAEGQEDDRASMFGASRHRRTN